VRVCTWFIYPRLRNEPYVSEHYYTSFKTVFIERGTDIILTLVLSVLVGDHQPDTFLTFFRTDLIIFNLET
jgi:hypothetical protein